MYSGNGHMNGVWGVVMILMMLGFFALIAVGIVWIARSDRLSHPTPPAMVGSTQAAERILAERMARGEIDQVEYQSRLSALTG